MGDKGGKGSQPKSALKSPGSKKGKDDTSNKGKKVQFDSEDSNDATVNNSTKAGGKGNNPFSKGGKGGKGDKVANGGKSSGKKAPAPLELRVEQEHSDITTCLMDSEAAEILQGIHEQMVVLSQDITIKIPISFDRGFQYAKRNNHYSNPESVRRILESLKEHGFADSEVCMIANICPESVDEVFALLPSLKGKKTKLKEPVTTALREIAKLKVSA